MIPSTIEPKDAPIELDVKQRIERYQKDRKEADALEAELMTRYHDEAVRAEELSQNKDHKDRPGESSRNEKAWQAKVWANWLAVKKLATDERAGLKKDLDAQTAAMKDALDKGSDFTAEQKKMLPVDEPVRRPIDWSNDLDRSDAIVSWGLHDRRRLPDPGPAHAGCRHRGGRLPRHVLPGDARLPVVAAGRARAFGGALSVRQQEHHRDARPPRGGVSGSRPANGPGSTRCCVSPIRSAAARRESVERGGKGSGTCRFVLPAMSFAESIGKSENSPPHRGNRLVKWSYSPRTFIPSEIRP